MKILVLSGTREGRNLADRLRPLFEVIESVAGRTSSANADRVGGFGGVAGLTKYLLTNQVSAVIDATHPFATQMTLNAYQACNQIGVPLLRLERPGWATRPDAKNWYWVDNHQQAARQAEKLAGAGVVLLTVGRQPLPYYRELKRVWARVSEWDGSEISDGWRILQERGPFKLSGELNLLNQVAVLVSKDSGGKLTAAKLDAAASLKLPVVMIARAKLPSDLSQASSIEQALEWVVGLQPGV